MIIFDAASHTYTNKEGVKYISISELIGLYKKTFDVDFFSRMVAKKRGISQNVIKEEWKKNTESACAFGKDIHATVEDFIKEGKVDEEHIIEEFRKVFPYTKETINSEYQLYNHEFKIAGTSDIIIDIGSDFFDVLDVKTNKKFDFFNKYGEYMLKPLDHLQNCKYNSYGIQLSLYAFMYSKLTGRKPRQLSIVYWNKATFERYSVPYMFWDVNILLKHYSKPPTINN